MRRRLLVAGFVYLSGAIGMEAVQEVFFDFSGSSHSMFVDVLLKVAIAVEEGLEVAGVLLALRAVWSPLQVRTGSGGLTIRTADDEKSASA